MLYYATVNTESTTQWNVVWLLQSLRRYYASTNCSHLEFDIRHVSVRQTAQIFQRDTEVYMLQAMLLCLVHFIHVHRGPTAYLTVTLANVNRFL